MPLISEVVDFGGSDDAGLPASQRQEILGALEAGIPGLPRDLGELMLGEFRNVDAQTGNMRAP